MNDLDTLRPEVRAAINRQDRQEKCDEYCPVCEDRATIRAELLRLTRERDHARQMHADRDEELQDALGRAENAEAELAAALKANRDCVDHFEQMQDELAAIKARITESPLEIVESLPGAVGPPWPRDHWIEVRMAVPCACVGQGLIGKRVRLVVEE